MPVFIKQCYFSKINTNINKVENISFLKSENSIYSTHAVAKTTAEPENSNNLDKANSSTPLNRAFFVRSTRTPKETTQLKIQPSEFLSMVACNGKGSPFAVFRVSQFSSPLHATAQTLESLAVAPEKPDTELSAMIYKFLTLTGSRRLTISIRATTETEARQRLNLSQSTICIARYSNAFLAKKQANLTACKGGLYA